MKQLNTTLIAVITTIPFSYGQLPLTAGSENPLTGTLFSTSVEGIRLNGNNTFLSGYDNAGSSRTGYLQFNAGGSVVLNAENATGIALLGSKVGIGTTSPGKQLDINGDTRILGTNKLYLGSPGFEATLGYNGINGNLDITPRSGYNTIFTAGYVGIGTASPDDLLQVNNGLITRFQVASTKGIWVNNEINGGTSSAPAALFLNYSSNGNTLLNTNGGSVGIGTTDPQGYKLAVNGNAIAESLTVKLHGNWPDYVFQPQYELPSLAALKDYIAKNQHLPELPSAADVIKNGVNLGEMVKLQTKKIEELTLYLIARDEQVNRQNVKLLQQDARINALEKALLKLTAGK